MIELGHFFAGEVLVIPEVLAARLSVEIDGLGHVVGLWNLPRLWIDLARQAHF